jgi:NADPH:quinone reductase-like Zn-dependent oxidoreductase
VGSVRLLGLTVDGSYAEYAVVDAGALVSVPDGLPLERAAFLHCTAAVALRALRDRARLRPGETVLVTGASGGVGMHAIQIARLLGASRVIAVTSRPEKEQPLLARGAEVIVAGGDFQRAVLALTGGGVDVALELVGAPTFHPSLRSLKAGGRLVLVGNVTTERVEMNPGWAIMREVAVLGSASASRADLAQVLEWAVRGALEPVLAEVLPLERAREAQERLRAGGVVGRLVLAP